MNNFYEGYKKKHPEEKCRWITLDNILEVVNGKTDGIKKEQCLITTLDGLVTWDEYRNGLEDDTNYLSGETLKAYAHHTKIAKRNDLVLGAISWDSQQYFICINNILDVAYVNEGNQVLRVKEGYNPLYIWYMLNNDPKIRFELLNLRNSGFGYLQLDLSKLKLLIPSIEYQNYFVNMMNEWDKRIDLEKRTVDKLKQVKSSLLDKMFI